MPDIRFEQSVDGDKVSLNIYGLDQGVIDEKDLLNEFQRTEFRRYFLNEESLQKACKILKKLQHEQRQSEAVESEAPADSEPLLAVSLIVAEKREAHVELEISEDKMQCFLMIETAFGEANPSITDLTRYLAEYDVVFGIKQNILQALASRLENLPPGSRVREVVAEGTAAGQNRPAELRFIVEPIQDRLMQPQLRDDGTVDMHDFGEIHLVNPGEILMERTPPVIGSPGTNVLGETISPPPPAERPLEPGEGTELNSANRNQLIATRKGVAVRVGNGMKVADTYCVADVDLKTGNVTFDGSVLIQGSVREGMCVKATGDVFVRDYIESAQVEAGRNLIVGKGVLGRQADSKHVETGQVQYTAHLSCGGDCHANYAQYADIEVGGALTIAKHIMHCRAIAHTIHVVSPKRSEGKILGGCVCPMQSLECNVLGAPSYIHTEVDFSRRFGNELGELQNINQELGERVNVVRGMRAALRQFEVKSGSPDIEEQVTKINNTVQHFENLIQVLKQRRSQLLKTIVAIRESLVIDVHKTLYPGVSIRFVDQDYPVREEKNLVQIKARDDGIGYFTLR